MQRKSGVPSAPVLTPEMEKRRRPANMPKGPPVSPGGGGTRVRVLGGEGGETGGGGKRREESRGEWSGGGEEGGEPSEAVEKGKCERRGGGGGEGIAGQFDSSAGSLEMAGAMGSGV